MPAVVLINTLFPTKRRSFFHQFNPPLGLLAIATPLIKAGFEVDLLDPQIEDGHMKHIEEAVSKGVLFVGMTTSMGANLINAVEISRIIKNIAPETPIIWGGPLATSAPALCLRESPVDYVVMGMGEETVVHIAKTLQESGDVKQLPHVSHRTNGGEKIADIYFFNRDLDELDYPELTLWEKGIRRMGAIPILSSLGCPRNCAFCYNKTFNGRVQWAARSADHVLGEMAHWAATFDIDNFQFVDDNFLVDADRACTILTESKKRGYKIGQIIGNMHDFKPEVLECIHDYIAHVNFSIESASLKIQKLLNKPIELDRAIALICELIEKGVEQVATNFMFGLPTETDEDIRANIEMAVKIRDINSTVRMVPHIYTPQPKDDILPQFDFYDKIRFSIDDLSYADMTPNRAQILLQEIRPWLRSDDIQFYLDLVLVWFYHFDHVVRSCQAIDVQDILARDKRLATLFADVPMPE